MKMNFKTLSSKRRLLVLALTVLLVMFVLLDLGPWPKTGKAMVDEGTEGIGSEFSKTNSSYPTTPPDASLITIGAPDVGGYALVSGSSGAVPPEAAVAIANLYARNVITATADISGAFSATLYAPAGSELLIKYDLEGDRVREFWENASSSVPIGKLSWEMLYPLPGAIIRTGGSPPSGSYSQSFDIVSSFLRDSPRGWAGWSYSGQVIVPPGGPGGLVIQQGNTFTVTGQLKVSSPAINCTGTPTATVHAAGKGLRYLFDSDGLSEPWGMWFNSHLFTPTGLPIEHEAGGEIQRIGEGVDATGLTCIDTHVFSGQLQYTITIPDDLPDGIYRPESLLFSDVSLAQDVPSTVVWYHNTEVVLGLPSLVVGSAGTPRIPWTLLADYPVNGHRGLRAFDDVGHFQMPTRVLIPPHRVVIPRVDDRTGEPLVYRLEPGSNWLSATDRRLPNPPHILLDPSSGEITIEIIQPDQQLDVIGPAPIRQSSVRTPNLPDGTPLAEGTGHIGDLYHLTTMDEAFAYSFDQYGPHTIIVVGQVYDIYGNVYSLNSTYKVMVARVLDLDPAQLPTTPYQQGDAFAPGLHVFPPVPAEVEVSMVHMPYSDPDLAVENSVGGPANRFGIFQPPPGTEIRFDSPGEFRVDISAEYMAPDGTLWAGYVTWGNVVEGLDPLIEAHGRRGMDYHSDIVDIQSPWFRNQDLPPERFGIENYYPYFSGDIHWGDETPDQGYKGDSIHSIITLRDLTGLEETIYDLIRSHYPRARNGFRWPPDDLSPAGLEKRLDINEAPLFITTQSGVDAAVEPEDIDLWGYWYGSSERPDVHVREIISEDNMGTAYWRFNDTYGFQIGEPADGDQPGDIKWEFGGAVFRTTTGPEPINEYAIYSSLWVLLPVGCDPSGCARVTAPFQGATGAGINGGPIMRLLDQDIDMFFLPKGVRPGDVMEVGDTISFSGHVGPPLNSRVEVTITSPSGVPHSAIWQANKIGWVYDPTFDFVAVEPGRWTVDVFVEHDQPYIGNGATPDRNNTGTVLGTSGQYEFYVVEPDSPRLFIIDPPSTLITWPDGEIVPIPITGLAPPGTTAIHYTIHDKGIVMKQGIIEPDESGFFNLAYNAVALHEIFPMLSLTAHDGRHEGLADEVTINMMAVGGRPAANSITFIGEEIFVASSLYHTQIPLILQAP
jgi:hypothetical protein